MKTTSLACIIDDDLLYVHLLKKIIKTRNLCDNLLVFNDGKESIDYFEEQLQDLNADKIPEIIFIDLNMPVMDGWEFIERFTKIEDRLKKDVTLYIVSSSIDPADIRRAESLSNIEGYLVKPAHISELENIFGRPA